jgi:hypothetical protein
MELQNFPIPGNRNALFINFGKAEGEDLKSMCRAKIAECNKRIKRIDENPKNEGQVTFQELKSDQIWTIEFCKELIDLLS